MHDVCISRTRAIVSADGNFAKPTPTYSGTRIVVAIPGSREAVDLVALYLARLAVVPSHTALHCTLQFGESSSTSLLEQLRIICPGTDEPVEITRESESVPVDISCRARHMCQAIVTRMPVLQGCVSIRML